MTPQSPTPKTVRIVQASNPDYWYADHIGEYVDVVESDRPLKYAVAGQTLGLWFTRYIDMADCDIVERANG